ncbi:MAG TPA: hypothetical protein VF116_00455 [Ktedonobacterales bacterium]
MDEEEENEPFSWEIDPTLLPPLFAAADAYAKLTPWQYVTEEPPVEVNLGTSGPEKGTEKLFGAVLGSDELVTGLAAYYTLEGYDQALHETLDEDVEPEEQDVNEMIETLRQMGAPVDQMPPEEVKEAIQMLMEQLMESGGVSAPEEINCLLMYLNSEEDTDPTYLDWLKQHHISYASSEYVPFFLRTEEDGDVRTLNPQEVKSLTITVEALNDFFTVERSKLEDEGVPEEPMTQQAQIGPSGSAALVTVTFPPVGYEWEEEDDETDEVGSPGPNGTGQGQ